MNGCGYKESDFVWHPPHLASPCSGVNGCLIPWHASGERQKVQRAHSSFKKFFFHKLLKINRKGRAVVLSHNAMLSFKWGDTRNSCHFVCFLLPGSPGIRELTSYMLSLSAARHSMPACSRRPRCCRAVTRPSACISGLGPGGLQRFMAAWPG